MKLIGYTRVSTVRQGQSRLGLEGQLADIRSYAESIKGEIVHIYREVESGRKDDRPELAKAMAHAKRVRGRLVIAKLDRLARDVHFVSGLTKANVDFIACDNPVANTLTIHILAAVAEDEAKRISARTRAALAAAKARGTLLGSARPGHWRGREARRRAGAAKGAAVVKAKRAAEAEPIYAPAAKLAGRMSDEGASLREIAQELNEKGMTTVRGFAWNPVQVSRLLKSAVPAIVAACIVG